MSKEKKSEDEWMTLEQILIQGEDISKRFQMNRYRPSNDELKEAGKILETLVQVYYGLNNFAATIQIVYRMRVKLSVPISP